jgi:hypothetical protein
METELIRQNKSPEIGELIKALVKVQANLEPSKKGSTNPFLKNKYSNLRECWDAAGPLLAENGLAVVQTFGGTAEEPSIITLLGHSSGQWIEGEMKLKPNTGGNACQQAGAAGTYGRRYGFCAAVGLYQEDLDGESPPKNLSNLETKKKTEKTGKQKAEEAGNTVKKVTEAQRKRLRAIAGDFEWDNGAVKSLIASYGYESSKDIESWQDYNAIIRDLQKGMDGKAKMDNVTERCIFANGKEKEQKKK